jgi:hypothetical protein
LLQCNVKVYVVAVKSDIEWNPSNVERIESWKGKKATSRKREIAYELESAFR